MTVTINEHAATGVKTEAKNVQQLQRIFVDLLFGGDHVLNAFLL